MIFFFGTRLIIGQKCVQLNKNLNWFHNRLGIGLEIVFAIDKTLATIELPALLRLNETWIKKSHFSVTYHKTRIESELFCGCIPLLTLIERYP